MTKLSQDIFKDAPDWVNSASVDSDGTVTRYSAYVGNICAWASTSYVEHYSFTKSQVEVLDTKRPDLDFGKIGRERLYTFRIWAHAGGHQCSEEEVFTYPFDHVPTQSDLDTLYGEYIGNILDSGISLVGDDDV